MLSKIPKMKFPLLALPIGTLVLASALVLVAAPSSSPSYKGTHGVSQRNAQSGITPAPIETPTIQPTPTETPTPVPTATPTQVPPNPTATPAQPSWHLLGNYSGTGAGTVATFNNPGTQVRIDWTCQETQSLPSWQIAFSIEEYTGEATGCKPGQTSGSFTLSHIPQTTVTLDVSGGCGGVGCPPIGPWTAAVYLWY